MANGSGLDAQWGWSAPESSYGSPASIGFFSEFDSETINLKKNTVQGMGLKAGSSVARSNRRRVTTREATGTITLDFLTAGLGKLLKAGFGSATSAAGVTTTTSAAVVTSGTTSTITSASVMVPGDVLTIDTAGTVETRIAASVTGSGPYVATVPALSAAHASGVVLLINGGSAAFLQTYTLAGTVGQSLTMQIGRPTLAGTVEPFTYPGTKVTGVDISAALNGLFKLALDVDCQDERTLGTSPAGAALASASYSTTAGVYSFLDSVLCLAGVPVAVATKVNTKIGQPMKSDLFYLGGGGLKGEPVPNAYKPINGSMDAEFVTRAALYDSFRTDAALSLIFGAVTPYTIPSSAAPYAFSIYCPDIRLDGDTPNVSGPDVLKQTVPYTALDTGAGSPITLKVVTSDSAI